MNHPSPIVRSRIITRLIFILLSVQYWITAIRLYKNFNKARCSLFKLRDFKRQYFGQYRFTKVARVGGDFFWMTGGPSYRSPALQTFIRNGLDKMIPIQKQQGLQILFLAITSKCPLRCEHCFEADNLGPNDVLSLERLLDLVADFQSRGVSQIQLSGGEPMSRYNDIITILQTAKKGTDFWINTSGFQLDVVKVKELKRAGLKGLIVSLDHYEESKHNQFRNSELAYEWAINAAKSGVEAKIPVTLSVCATRNFVTMENLMSYAKLSRELGVSFIQLLEPKAIGNYKGQDVALTSQHKQVLIDFYELMTYNPKYRTWPIVNYHEYFKERAGCFGAGNRFMYINSKGEMQACPFCDKSFGNIYDKIVSEQLIKMSIQGCPEPEYP